MSDISEQTPQNPRLPLRVLPDPKRMQRILRNAEAWQQQVADEKRQTKEDEMSQTEALEQAHEQANCGAGFQPAVEDAGTAQAESLHHNAAAHPGKAIEKKLLEGKIIERLRTIYDPELPVNIYDLGLIYAIDIGDDNQVDIRMTLTAPACPVAGQIVTEVQAKVQNIDEVKRADVELVWDPPWCREMISEAAQLELGLL